MNDFIWLSGAKLMWMDNSGLTEELRKGGGG